MGKNKKINILFLTSAVNIGGAEKNILNHLDSADFDRFNLTVGSFSSGGILEYEVCKRGFQFIYFRRLLYLLTFLKKNKTNIIQLYGLKANILSRFIGKLARCKVIATIRSIDSQRKWYHVVLDRLTSPFVDLWISNSYAGKDIAIKREKFPTEKIKVIHNGIDLSKYIKLPDNDIMRLKKHYGIAENDIVIGEVANLRNMKGHIDIINAIPTIIQRYENIKFFFAGEDASNGKIEKYAREKKIDKYIIFAGYCDNIPEILSLFDILILPSLWEGLPNSIIEAMAIGLPVIATKVGGIPELMDDGENGILIDPKSPQQIASAILYLLENKDLAKSMGERNIARAWQNNDIKQKARDYEKIYMELMKK
jgi:glycosyltransferase involved in cell wall biosynthesis